MAETRRTSRDRKVPKTYRLSPAKVAAAQRILGTPTATETIEAALDLVVFRDELVAGTRALLGTDIAPPDLPGA
jgi:hypothetical protein